MSMMVLDTKGKLTPANTPHDMVQLWTWRSEFEVRGLGDCWRVMDETS